MVTRKTALVLAMNKRKFRGPKAEHDEGTIKKSLTHKPSLDESPPPFLPSCDFFLYPLPVKLKWSLI